MYPRCDIKTGTPQSSYCKCDPKPCNDWGKYNPGSPESYLVYCQPKPCHGREDKNTVHVTTNVSISQRAEANGGNANGGNGGNAGGSAAASAASGENASANSSALNAFVGEPRVSSDDPEPQNDAAIEEESVVSATVGSATGGNGGSGGTGGNGGAASNSSAVQVDNMIIICCDGNGPGTAIKLGTNDRKVDITVDQDGNTFVNGKKMDEEELENGTKVFIFRNTEVKKMEAGSAEI